MVSPDKVAVCLTCGNEWEVRTAGTGKKRKCPVCGKYRVKMRSELKEGENEPNPDSKTPDRGRPSNVPVGATPPGRGLDGAKSDGMDKERERGKKEGGDPVPPAAPAGSSVSPPESAGASGGVGFGLLLLLVGAGVAVSFLVSRGRRGRGRPAEEVEHYERIPAFPGF